MNSSDQRLADIIQYAQAGRLGDAGYGLLLARMALAWFVQHARWITDLRPRTLHTVADLARDHPQEWQQRARATLCAGCDRDITMVWPIPRIEPRDPVPRDEYIIGTFPDILADRPAGRVHASVFSPPYAGQRSRAKMAGKQFDGVPLYYRDVAEVDYPAWMVGIMREIDRALNDRGSVIFVAAEHMRGGFYSRYLHDTITALLDDGWQSILPLFSPWRKRDSAPVGRRDRPRLDHEPYFWLSKRSRPYTNVTEGGRPSDRIGMLNGWGVMHQASNRCRSGIARVTSTVDVPVGSIRTRLAKHPARHPVELYAHFIRLCCPIGGIVLDPFAGSGTTALAARATGRHYLCVEENAIYARDAQRELTITGSAAQKTVD